MSEPKENDTFDFEAYEQTAVVAYLKVQEFYHDLAAVIARIIEECLKKRKIKVLSVQSRAKDSQSFGRKAASPSESDPSKPKYTEPLKQITDLAGVRVITFFPDTIKDVDRLIYDEFEVAERSDKGNQLIVDEKFGYQSIHYLVKLNTDRGCLAEYEQFKGAVAEVQVRTILQHAWAEIEHDIQYKSTATIPNEIRRRFMALSGMLEVADREFQAIQHEDKQLAEQARASIRKGKLDNLEITPDALREFLDKRLGTDARISGWTYDWMTRLLKQLGFKTLDQVATCIANYNDYRLSDLLWGGQLGQIARFEYMLLAGMGERFIQKHLYSGQWFEETWRRYLKKLHEAKIPVGDFDPTMQPTSDRRNDSGL